MKFPPSPFFLGYNDKNHHISGAIKVRELLMQLGYPYTEEVQHCIEAHRGSTDPQPVTLEAKVVASADAISLITKKSLLWYSAYDKHHLTDEEAKRKVELKLANAYKRLMPEAKLLLSQHCDE